MVVEEEVVCWVVFVDEVIVEEEGMVLGVEEDVGDVGNVGKEDGCVGGVVVVGEIRIERGVEIVGFWEVDDEGLVVEVLVDGGRLGKVE